MHNNTNRNLSYLFVSAATLLFYITIIPLADGVITYLNNYPCCGLPSTE